MSNMIKVGWASNEMHCLLVLETTLASSSMGCKLSLCLVLPSIAFLVLKNSMLGKSASLSSTKELLLNAHSLD